MMRLFEIPNGSKLKLSVSKDGESFGEETITFHHVDGMYSFCTVDAWPEGENVCHLSAVAPMKKVDDHYELDEEPNEEENELH